jgi:hypothetical protein
MVQAECGRLFYCECSSTPFPTRAALNMHTRRHKHKGRSRNAPEAECGTQTHVLSGQTVETQTCFPFDDSLLDNLPVSDMQTQTSEGWNLPADISDALTDEISTQYPFSVDGYSQTIATGEHVHSLSSSLRSFTATVSESTITTETFSQTDLLQAFRDELPQTTA